VKISHWYNLLRNFSIIGAVCSILITVLNLILFWSLLKNTKNQHKTVGETSLEKYMNVIMIGLIFTVVFVIILLILT